MRGAKESDGAERRASRDEVDFVFVRAGEEGRGHRCGLPGVVGDTCRVSGTRPAAERRLKSTSAANVPHLLERSDLLTTLWWLPLEHVTVVGFGRGSELWQRRDASTV